MDMTVGRKLRRFLRSGAYCDQLGLKGLFDTFRSSWQPVQAPNQLTTTRARAMF
jgi:hypothetical protein